jgi:ABC-type transport system substrate-binding protein
VDRTNRVSGRRAVVLVVAVMATLSLAAVACGKSSSSGSSSGTNPPAAKNGTNITVANPGSPKPGGTLKFGLNAETNGWSPVVNEWAGSAYIVAGAIFDHLAEYDDHDVPKPYLAESISSNADFTQWTIKMRPGVTFQDGEKCDAQAVADNFNAQRASALTGAVFQTVTAVKVVDPLTVQLTMNQPWSTFPNTLTTQPGAMAAPKAMLDKDPGPNNPSGDGGSTHPVGTGPFTFVSWTQNSKLEVKKNPNYWRKGYPLLDGIEFQIVTATDSRTSALQTGALDAIEQGDPPQIQKLAAAAEAGQLQFFTDAGVVQTEAFQAFNTAKPPFNDLLARQIVAYATDRVNLNKVIFQGAFTPATGPFGPDEPYYAKGGSPAYDPVKAKQLEQQYEKKYGHPLTFSMIVTPQPTVVGTGTFLQQGMTQAGAKMTLKPEDQATLISDVILGNYQSTAFELFGAPTLDTNYVFIANSTIRPVGQLSLNFTHYNDPVLTQALNDARKTSDIAAQLKQYQIVQEQMGKNLMFVFWAHLLQSIAYTNSVHDLTGYKLPDGSTALRSIVPLTFAAWKS